eukprot:TRINITY_DN21759_c0_g1_i3.p1 TRINITY_DN21759_c0_g1~~TRINITY_DN21759_c0_g1_i3.p1  ORF type:complete len:150 (-),score=59.08 TRINITY_DN21759_c0_g1_i3:201-650(-)
MYRFAFCPTLHRFCFFFFQAEDGIRDAQESRGLGDVYKRQINPLSPGHTLVVPKKIAERSTDIPEEALPSFGAFLQKVIKTVVPEGTPYNLLQNNGGEAGQVVMQVHFHVIPKVQDGRGLKVEWKAESGDQEELTKACAAFKAKFETLL